MEKIISELKKLLDSGAIKQEDYDLAISKLGAPEDNPGNQDNENEPKENDNPNPEGNPPTGDDGNPTDDDLPEDEDVNPEDNPEVVDNPSEDPTPTDNPNPEVVDNPSNGNSDLQVVLEKLSSIEQRLANLEQANEEVDPTKPVGEEVNLSKKEPKVQDYGPGIRTIYSK